ncbi:hypothetical protein HPB52_011072 [Rhipicephalus sanguineus]|uniref:Uncharacterized protein n=1 Tax=Rhipicephalus sanguineus TaxID=34632 RepID=A0A9D4QCQ5_RHISA|nr:hypothetical protein HPB52_011072 [Rhipicephalus sanguineus]
MDLFAQRISDPSQLDYCPVEDFVREVPEPRLAEVVAARLRDVSLYQLLGWATSLVLAVLALVCMVCKVYSRLTVGRCTSNKDLTGRTVIITGANTGIGKETAKELARRNARVIMACRNPEKAAAAAKEILDETGRQVVVRKLDLCSFKSIREFADDINNSEERLDVLINNAGIVRVTANVLHPGAVQTDINSTYVGLMNITMNALFYFFGKTPQEGAQTSIYLTVSDEVAKVTGQYFMDCRRALPSKNAEDPTLARRLWEVSEKLTGLSI